MRSLSKCFREPEDETKGVLDDCYECLTCMAKEEVGRQAIITHGCVMELSRVIVEAAYGT